MEGKRLIVILVSLFAVILAGALFFKAARENAYLQCYDFQLELDAFLVSFAPPASLALCIASVACYAIAAAMPGSVRKRYLMTRFGELNSKEKMKTAFNFLLIIAILICGIMVGFRIYVLSGCPWMIAGL